MNAGIDPFIHGERPSHNRGRRKYGRSDERYGAQAQMKIS